MGSLRIGAAQLSLIVSERSPKCWGCHYGVIWAADRSLNSHGVAQSCSRGF